MPQINLINREAKNSENTGSNINTRHDQIVTLINPDVVPKIEPSELFMQMHSSPLTNLTPEALHLLQSVENSSSRPRR